MVFYRRERFEMLRRTLALLSVLKTGLSISRGNDISSLCYTSKRNSICIHTLSVEPVVLRDCAGAAPEVVVKIWYTHLLCNQGKALEQLTLGTVAPTIPSWSHPSTRSLISYETKFDEMNGAEIIVD